MKFILLYIALFSSVTLASESCELTDNYKAARSEAMRAVRGSESAHYKCINSVREAHYWKAVAACEVEGKGEGIGGGCQHISGYSFSHNHKESDVSHCEVLKHRDPKKVFEMWLDDIVRTRNIVKCKHNQPSKKDGAF